MYNRTDLENGIRIVTHAMPNMRSVSLGIWLNVGGRYETKKIKGIAHFLEHLLFKGSKKYSGLKIKQSIEGVGGSLNGFTSEEFTCYLVKIPAQYLRLSLDILADMILNPALPKKEVEKERIVIIEEIKMHKDIPQSYVYELLDELLWPNQALGLSIMGSVESISQIKRVELFNFKNSHYTPPNLIIAACGSLEHKRFSDKVEEIFSHLKPKHKNKFIKAKETQRCPQLKILNKDTEQTHLAIGFHGISRSHPDRYALGLLHIILGANMSSRLFNKIREKKGLAYEIGTQVKYLSDTGAFIIHAGVDKRKVSRAIELILKELSRIKKESISKDELSRAKEFYLGQLVLALEDTLEHMLWMGELTAGLDKVYTWDEISGFIDRISREDIMRVAEKIFKPNNVNIALIGPLKGKEKEIYKSIQI